jgi:molybdopterin-containing oxidoreductase family iron-sulfur binding subunit
MPRIEIPIVASAEAATPSRRTVLQWLAAATALAASGCSRPPADRIYSYGRTPEIEANGTPIDYASASMRAGHALGILIGTQQGRPVKVEGNPEHPASLGTTDALAQAEILDLWDPDRSQAVRRGTAPSTWPDFMSAWHARRAPAVHVLAPTFTSPATARALAALLDRYPGSRWYHHDPASSSAALDGATLAFGRPLRSLHRFDRAELIVTLGGDPFADPAAGVRYAADWARVRASSVTARRLPARLIALETAPSLFGARADERWALAPPAIEQVLWRAAVPLLPGLARIEGGDASLDPIAARLSASLARYRGRALLWGGPALSPASQGLVLALNQALGTAAGTSALIAPPDQHDGLPAPGTLADLVQSIDGGAESTLLILGGNPGYSAATNAGFAAALAKATCSVHLSDRVDETSAACHWHLPSSHTFEQWSDARAFDGTATLIQPAIAPLYDTRSPLELLDLLVHDDPTRSGQTLLREHWRGQVPAGDFEAWWRTSLRRGVVPASGATPIEPGAARLPAPPAPAAAAALWVTFPLDASVLDGSRANNAWLQELPRPLTHVTWDNALQLGPRTAQALGVGTGDVVRAQAGDGAAVDVPVWVHPDHAEGAATLPLGYGRRAAGRIGNGIGVDSAPLRGVGGAAPVALQLEKSGRRHAFAITQVETDQHDRALARTLAPANLAYLEAHAKPEPSLYAPIPDEGASWAMVIDLDACTGCNACTIACQAENNIPTVGPDEVRAGRTMHWIRVDTYRDAAGHEIAQPVPCMHCENAPCEVVCPVGATVHDSEGLNLQVYNRCVGTRFCSNNCPYKVRRFNFRQYADLTTETAKLMHNPDVTVRARGVMEKCSYCVQRLSRARRSVQKTGEPLPRDGVRTACQSVCPTGAIHFGNLMDTGSDVVRAKAEPRHYAMLDELNTRPRTTYLARLAALPKEDA